jgi:hypothetical protein
MVLEDATVTGFALRANALAALPADRTIAWVGRRVAATTHVPRLHVIKVVFKPIFVVIKFIVPIVFPLMVFVILVGILFSLLQLVRNLANNWWRSRAAIVYFGAFG